MSIKSASRPLMFYVLVLWAFGIEICPTMTGADVTVELFEAIPATWDGTSPSSLADERWSVPSMAFVNLPNKYDSKSALSDRKAPFLVRSGLEKSYPAGTYDIILRSRARSILKIDGIRVAETTTISPNASGHEDVPPVAMPDDRRWRALETNSQERRIVWKSDGNSHSFELLSVIGDKNTRPETGELLVAILPRAGGDGLPRLLSDDASQAIELTDSAWKAFRIVSEDRTTSLNRQRRKAAYVSEDNYWKSRHDFARRYVSQSLKDLTELTPARLNRLIASAAPERKSSPPTNDYQFLRRIYLDTVGVPPTLSEQLAFLNDPSPDRRAKLIDRLLDDNRRAGNWVGYWQDVLAENPGILKPTLNNTGPFRYFLHESLSDNIPMDRLVTQLIRMDGSVLGGAAGGFSMASQNDSPMAAKAHILAKAFMASEMKCARCHDAPKHPYEQADLFELAALLAGKALSVPKSSTVAVAPGARVPAISISLEAGDEVAPRWSLGSIGPDSLPAEIMPNNATSRDRLAALITWPGNNRFARVLVNRVWAVRTGRPFVEPLDDWDVRSTRRFPEAMEALAADFMRNGYDLKRLERMIFNTDYYQAGVVATDGEKELLGPARRGLSAEQLVDSLFATAGKSFDCEELSLDPEGRRPAKEFLNMGHPRRAWEMVSPSNERDRPALGLPAATEITDLMQAFGWRPTRQDPITLRESAVTPLQPGLLASGLVHTRIARMSDDNRLTEIALQSKSINELADLTIRQVLSRPATNQELADASTLFGPLFENRVVAGGKITAKPPRSHRQRVSWSNHLSPRATEIQLEEEALVRAGDPATQRLSADFRETYEDWAWALFNSTDFLFIP